MDFLYAITLLVAAAAAVIAISTNVLGLIKPGLQTIRLTQAALALGFVSLATSVVVHSRWGHGPGTVAPMDLRRLLTDHETFPAIAATLLLALGLAMYRNRG